MASQQEEQIKAVIQAISGGQDISNFDAQTISAAKQYTAMKANELNQMVNSSSMPPNVTREMARNELDMYQGLADKLAEDDPQFANAMDIALIGAGVYAAAKYGPMAAAKAKSAAGAAYGYGQQAYGSATGAARTGYEGVKRAATAGMGAASDFASRGASYLGSPEFRGSKVGQMGQRTYGYGKNVGSRFMQSPLGKGVRRMFKIPF